MRKAAIVLVLYRTELELGVLLPQLRSHLPEFPIVSVDNNPLPGGVEKEIVESHANTIYVAGNCGGTHGAGINIALEWCRHSGIETMLHIEPDCQVCGTGWAEKLLQAIELGACVAGSKKKCYGPLDITPTAWRTSIGWGSFEVCKRIIDEQHVKFNELVHLDRLYESIAHRSDACKRFWKDNWDTGQANWFQAAIASRAVYAGPCDDITHQSRSRKSNDPQ